ncbi:hypothetical protein [Hoylesella marshii]|nr:hypothetical protein [Hoylesella marshii]
MKKKPFRKQPYVSPAIEVIRTPFDNLLLSSSFNNSGGHKEADDEDWEDENPYFPGENGGGHNDANDEEW